MNFLKTKGIYTLFTALPLLMVLAISFFGWSASWKFFQIPSVSPPFFDFRLLPAIVMSDIAGFDPQYNNPYDPSQRLLNYPLVWIQIAKFFNLSNHDFFYLSASLIVAIYLCCCFRILHLSKSFWVIFIVFSGSSLLAMERANTDLIIFILLFFSATAPKWLGIVFNLIGVILKLYPFFALITFYKQPKSFFFGVLISLAIFYLYRNQLYAIANNTQISYGASYGSLAIANSLIIKLDLYINQWWINFAFIMASFLCLSIKKPLVEYSHISNLDIDLCMVGASVYVGTFLIASNWDYRLIFLNLCLPLISKITDMKLMHTIYAVLFFSCNQFLLHFFFGQGGAIFNMLTKSVVFILCLIFILDTLRKNITIFSKN